MQDIQLNLVPQEKSFWEAWWEKIKTFFTKIPGRNIAIGLAGCGLLYQILRTNGYIDMQAFTKYFTMNLAELKSGNLWGLVLSPFAHMRWDSFIFSSASLFLTVK